LGEPSLLFLFERIYRTFGCCRNRLWIQTDIEIIASAGWRTLAYYAAVHEDEELDTNAYIQLLDTKEKEIHDAQNKVKYTMNGFVIALGTYAEELTEKSKEVAKEIGKISVDAGGTACKVPLTFEYLDKAIAKG
jgi:hypothetical protein